MYLVLLAWAGSALVLALSAVWLGKVSGRGNAGILIDSRGRYSLTQFQVTLWTVVVLSLLAALCLARVYSNIDPALDFAIPTELLVVLGISVGSAVASTTIKAEKSNAYPQLVTASNSQDPPRLIQIFTVEEGDFADQVVDVTKYQNFWLTVVLVIAYVALVTKAIVTASSVQEIVLPGFSEGFVYLLGISHTGYLANKLPPRPGTPHGLTIALMRQNAKAKAETAEQVSAPTFVPRNTSSRGV